MTSPDGPGGPGGPDGPDGPGDPDSADTPDSAAGRVPAALAAAATALGLFVVGVGTGVATLAVHSRSWGLPLAVLATLAALLAVRPGALTRLVLALGWVLPVGLAFGGRPEGDFVLANGPAGYAVLVLAAAVLAVAVGTLGAGRRRAISGRPHPAT